MQPWLKLSVHAEIVNQKYQIQCDSLLVDRVVDKE